MFKVMDNSNGRVYVYQGVNPYHQRRIMVYLRKRLWGTFWQYMRKFDYERIDNYEARYTRTT